MHLTTAFLDMFQGTTTAYTPTLQIAGYNREEVVGRNCRFLQGPGTDPEAVQQVVGFLKALRTRDLLVQSHCTLEAERHN